MMEIILVSTLLQIKAKIITTRICIDAHAKCVFQLYNGRQHESQGKPDYMAAMALPGFPWNMGEGGGEIDNIE